VDLFPAIDIRSGRVVRLSQGEAARQTVYGDDPAAVAERFVAEGAKWIHVVDLDRAFGTGQNLATIRDLVDRVRGQVRLQLGGGFRSLELIQAALDLGADRIVVGTAAAIDREFIPRAVAAGGGSRLAVGVDVRGGYAMIRGWTEATGLRADDLARRVVDQGVTTVIHTDVMRDGMLGGPDLDGALALRAVGAAVIASGGVASLDDIRAVGAAGLAGVIVGRALYEGRFRLAEALEAAE